MKDFSRAGILFLLSAPSGAGKSTLCESLHRTPDFIYSISCTTRAPREGEVDGRDYFFLSRDDFFGKAEAGDFLEHAEVHGHFYGTRASDVLVHLEAGDDVLIDVDTQGAEKIRAAQDPRIREALVDIFLLPPPLDELERRLRRRGTDDPEQIALRLENARREMEHWRDYQYTIINSSIEENLARFRAIMRAERCRSRRLTFQSNGIPLEA